MHDVETEGKEMYDGKIKDKEKKQRGGKTRSGASTTTTTRRPKAEEGPKGRKPEAKGQRLKVIGCKQKGRRPAAKGIFLDMSDKPEAGKENVTSQV